MTGSSEKLLFSSASSEISAICGVEAALKPLGGRSELAAHGSGVDLGWFACGEEIWGIGGESPSLGQQGLGGGSGIIERQNLPHAE